MISWISRPCDSPCEELDAGDRQPCRGAFDGFLEVLGAYGPQGLPEDGELAVGLVLRKGFETIACGFMRPTLQAVAARL